MDILKKYVDFFNENDEESYHNLVSNDYAYEWLREEIPLFSCPDKDIEQAYYFRWWTYRKHLRLTDDGYIITEFLPKVPWSGKHNEINAAVGHHIYEGRWLKNGKKYLSEYIRFFLDHSDRGHQYSAWLADALLRLCEISGDYTLGQELLSQLVCYYEEWESTHLLENGMFWSLDGYDAMEYSISGTDENLRSLRGIRPTLNSYMCADAYAISRFSERCGDMELSARFQQKGDMLKEKINSCLFEDGFYRAYHFADEHEIPGIFDTLAKKQPRELIGFIPWAFGIPKKGFEKAFSLLDDPTAFYSEQGLTTAERSHPRYLYPVNHECLWNGYVWPFATSQVLTALYTVIRDYSDSEEYKELFYKLLKQYAAGHHRIKEDGTKVPWIDEVRHPEYDDWSSRTILKEKWEIYERGKDYNHSTFCDLVISGLVGVSASADGGISVNPCIPGDWEYFTLDGVHVGGKSYFIEYRNGNLRVEPK
jgi:hypothetical protein